MLDLKLIKKNLETKKVDLLKRLQSLEDDIHRRKGPISQDYGDQSQEIENDEVVGSLDGVERAELNQIVYALARMEDGTYGVCVECGQRIAEKRLEARPTATQCINCATEFSN
jgi:DnaK suppressor protein